MSFLQLSVRARVSLISLNAVMVVEADSVAVNGPAVSEVDDALSAMMTVESGPLGEGSEETTQKPPPLNRNPSKFLNAFAGGDNFFIARVGEVERVCILRFVRATSSSQRQCVLGGQQ
jgi:hypothetical protein